MTNEMYEHLGQILSIFRRLLMFGAPPEGSKNQTSQTYQILDHGLIVPRMRKGLRLAEELRSIY